MTGDPWLCRVHRSFRWPLHRPSWCVTATDKCCTAVAWPTVPVSPERLLGLELKTAVLSLTCSMQAFLSIQVQLSYLSQEDRSIQTQLTQLVSPHLSTGTSAAYRLVLLQRMTPTHAFSSFGLQRTTMWRFPSSVAYGRRSLGTKRDLLRLCR